MIRFDSTQASKRPVRLAARVEREACTGTLKGNQHYSALIPSPEEAALL